MITCKEAVATSQNPQSSSTETHYSFAAAPAAINDTPGSVESGGGGTISLYVAPGSGTSTSDFTMVSNVTSNRGSARRSTSARSPRSRRPSAAIEDANGLGPTDVAGEASRSATSSKRKSSGSASRNEGESRLRRQLQHSNEKLDRSEPARAEVEGRLKLLQDALNHRDQMIRNVEVYSHQHHEEYQEHVNTEMEYMRASLTNAYNMLNSSVSPEFSLVGVMSGPYNSAASMIAAVVTTIQRGCDVGHQSAASLILRAGSFSCTGQAIGTDSSLTHVDLKGPTFTLSIMHGAALIRRERTTFEPGDCSCVQQMKQAGHGGCEQSFSQDAHTI